MSVFLIALTEPSDEALEKIQAAWPERHHAITETLCMVSPEGVATPRSILEKVGIDAGGEAPNGMVLPMEHGMVSGVLPRESATWFKAARDG